MPGKPCQASHNPQVFKRLLPLTSFDWFAMLRNGATTMGEENMKQEDWINLMRAHTEMTKEMASEVPKALADPDLTLEMASSLHSAVEKLAQKFESFFGEMEECDLDENLFDENFFKVAESLEDIWDKLAVDTANKVRTMQGLKPIE
jgi:hypothetical protein